ncbi:tRNA lysidine(34) synthetase TilS [Mycolicibacterium pyrenivorans]|uniref:tRNA lysidine(34) synthetase TilS n=1 Tax=Mycolicibacterium pyrenivorans TaxID=187102 RepID=UPI0021F38F55|nr:tRNA lysidine(34) synthetase TilS [Mycolicibacterium pyrenivorans]MCV7153422.1 tRNA lysidine(34) synthetase TilS [Mycolicibacterium pyrenivorans]
MDRPGAVAELRAVVARFARDHTVGEDRWCVALSGGPDSLALTAAAATVMPTTALIVDHRLQPDSSSVAATARDQALALGCVRAEVLCVEVGTAGGPEAAARAARYRALDDARAGAPVLLAHTLDDQAETVLLGLGRGSGARSIAGMRPCDPPWYRPLLAVRREVTHRACAELRLTPWQDPHNTDRRYTRVRLRTDVLPALEEALGGGVAEALARTATALREDNDTLDGIAAEILTRLAAGGDAGGLPTAALAPLPEGVRRRVIRGWLLAGGAVGLTDKQIRAVDGLITAWRGQGGVAVPSAQPRTRLFAGRRSELLMLYREPV